MLPQRSLECELYTWKLKFLANFHPLVPQLSSWREISGNQLKRINFLVKAPGNYLTTVMEESASELCTNYSLDYVNYVCKQVIRPHKITSNKPYYSKLVQSIQLRYSAFNYPVLSTFEVD